MTVERRKHRRVKVSQPVTVLRRDGSLIADCMLRDISAGGARLQFDVMAEVPKALSLRVPRGGRVHRHCELVWQSDNEVGVRFVTPEADVIEAAAAPAQDLTYLSPFPRGKRRMHQTRCTGACRHAEISNCRCVKATGGCDER
jgi:hypothetical protein